MKEIVLDQKDAGAEIARFRDKFTEMTYCLPYEKEKALTKQIITNIFS